MFWALCYNIFFECYKNDSLYDEEQHWEVCSSFHDVWPSELCQEHVCLSCIYREPELSERGSHERVAELGIERYLSTGAVFREFLYGPATVDGIERNPD